MPVCTSLQGKSAFPETHPLALGSGGLATTGPVDHFLKQADLIFGIGCSFTDTSFGVKMPAGKTIIHATLDPADVNHDVGCALAVLGDAKLVLAAIIEEVRRQGVKKPKDPQRVAAEIKEVHEAWLEKWLPKLTYNDAPLSPYRVLWDLQNTVDVANTIITHDAGSPRDQLSPFWRYDDPAELHRLGQDHAAGRGPRLRHGRQARQAGQALHQRVGRCGDRLHGHGSRDGRAREDPDPVDPAQQLLHGHRA